MPLTYDFASGRGIGRDVLGGKGHGLVAMAALDIPVPTGFIIGAPARAGGLTGELKATGSLQLKDGETISLDGDNGVISRGARALVDAEEDPALARFLTWQKESA